MCVCVCIGDGGAERRVEREIRELNRDEMDPGAAAAKLEALIGKSVICNRV